MSDVTIYSTLREELEALVKAYGPLPVKRPRGRRR